MMAQLDRAAEVGKDLSAPEEQPEAKPEVKPDVKPDVKPEAKPDVKPTAKPVAKDDMNEEAMEKFLKQHQKPWKVYDAAKKGWQTKIQTAEAKIKELESRASSPQNDQRIEALTKQLDELRGESTKYKQELTKRDYTASEDYDKNFRQKATAVYTEAVQFINQLKVPLADGGERAATQSDFDEIRALPLGARRKAANDKFGDYAPDVLNYCRDIDNIRRDADSAVKLHAEKFEKEASERQTMSAKQQQEYDNFYKSSLEGLKTNENYGKWFSESPDDPEASELLKSGFDEIEKVSATINNLPPDQQAAYAAVFKARAAAFPRMMLEYNRASTKVAALEKELAKYRGSAPGARGKSGEQPISDGKPRGGISDAAAVFDQIPKY